FFGRNEEDGIRCVYHGWKFDVTGKCLDMANVPPHQDFKHKVHAKAYPTVEKFGALWVYMGNRETPPPFPDFELNDIPEDEIHVRFIQMEYNWLQGLENDIDTSHFGFLHLGGIDPASIDRSTPTGNQYYHLAIDRAPQFHIEETPMGLMYGAYRPADEISTHWRLAQFIVPFWIMPPAGDLHALIGMKGYIPMDDGHTMTIFFTKRFDRGPASHLESGAPLPGVGAGPLTAEYQENTTDWLGRWRIPNAPENDYLIDRDLQRDGGVYSGIIGIQVQDNAIAGTMGPITDRTFEHLASSDEMIARARRALLRLVQRHQNDPTELLPGVDDSHIYRGHRSGNFVAPNETPFRDAYTAEIKEHANAEPGWPEA
ncbi:MAG: (2Fe-2S)-binding protein, partial [Proteobacteria bacterium]|nr:(2Fe-2S)-binding protein [Pseudomonadota bacterium]